MQKIQRKFGIMLLTLSAIGLIDALYLSYARYAHIDVPCSITNGGCSVVAASPYAVMFGVPLAYLGVLFYIVVSVLAVLLIMRIKIKKLNNYILVATLFGALDSLYFLYLQGFVIKAFCVYCIISALTSFVLLVVAYIFNQKLKALTINKI